MIKFLMEQRLGSRFTTYKQNMGVIVQGWVEVIAKKAEEVFQIAKYITPDP
jgi:hypothetical protein